VIRRVFAEKKPSYAVEAEHLYSDLKTNLALLSLEGLRIVNRYDLSDINEESFNAALYTVFAEPVLDDLYLEEFPLSSDEKAFAMEYLPGQFDQRADSAAQCLRILNNKLSPLVHAAKVIVLRGKISDAELEKVKAYCINPVDSKEASMDKPQTLDIESPTPPPVPYIEGFIVADEDALDKIHQEMGLAMSLEDLSFCQGYFREQEKRDPTVTEIRVIDTYWSDHCRHTTFLTRIWETHFDEGHFNKPVLNSYQAYLKSRKLVHGDKQKDISLMDIATIAMKELRLRGLLDDLDASEEINACSIKVDIKIDGQKQPWLLMFKNETHNHPTEIEPFGGAATCLGGAIRDPLSGRSYVYQAMRVTGSGDPRADISLTIPGKLPQRKITREAARGYSSYGNQIGLATGQVAEVYHEGFLAKRMEIGAVIGAAPHDNVVRDVPKEGDQIILLGGRTGRDGCGGATGSSKEHDENSLAECGAEVQKGNPPTERKLQRLFRNDKASRLIKRCNDFGAGGVSVAIGELTDALDINLDAVPKKYDGLDGTELAISESQERMAVVLSPGDVPSFIKMAQAENLEATVVATVTDNGRLRMNWREQTVVDISREFLNTNGVRQETKIAVASPNEEENFFGIAHAYKEGLSTKAAWLANLSHLQHAAQKGLVEQFDSTIGASTVLMPFGGAYQLTPAAGMAALFPVLDGVTTDASLMSYGYNPRLASWSPYHGGMYAVIEAISKIVAMGGSPNKIRLSLQEYFEKLGKDPYKWGKPLAALLGAFEAQRNFDAPAIGGKDSMSGTFQSLHVPPTLVAFAVTTVADARRIISPEFKKSGSHVVMVPLTCNRYEIPDFATLKNAYECIHQLIQKGLVLAAQPLDQSGVAGGISKMCFGNQIGMFFDEEWEEEVLYMPEIGSLVLEIDGSIKPEKIGELFDDVDYLYLGKTKNDGFISINDTKISIADCTQAWLSTLEGVFPYIYRAKSTQKTETAPSIKYESKSKITCTTSFKKPTPRVLIPIFPGSNCEYDTALAFQKAGGDVETLVFRNLSSQDIEESIAAMAEAIKKSQIIALPGGFSAGDEPEGSGKFIAAIFKNPRIREAVAEHLEQKDGLMLGICNGFQALIKLGLVPYGKIQDMEVTSPTLTFNNIGRHISTISRTRIVSNLSPWFNQCYLDDIYNIAISHGEGRFVATHEELERLAASGQIATQYVDSAGNVANDPISNPNGSSWAIEGITSPDGRVLGKMAHCERMTPNAAINIPGVKDMPIFISGIKYFA